MAVQSWTSHVAKKYEQFQPCWSFIQLQKLKVCPWLPALLKLNFSSVVSKFIFKNWVVTGTKSANSEQYKQTRLQEPGCTNVQSGLSLCCYYTQYTYVYLNPEESRGAEIMWNLQVKKVKLPEYENSQTGWAFAFQIGKVSAANKKEG